MIKQSKFIDFYAGKALSWGLVGVPGTGKTVLSIIYIIQNIHKFKILASNIKGLKVDLIKQATGAEFEYIEFDNTKESLTAHMKYIETLNKDLPEENRIISLNIVDECHKIFRFHSSKDVNEIYMSDFLSETRHKGPAYWIFLTQNFKKIHYMYRGDIAFWFQTQQDELKKSSDDIFFKKYDSELDTRIEGQDIILHRFKDTKFIGVDGKEYSYFDFYTSGDGGRQVHKNKSIVAKKILQIKILFVVILLFVILAIYFFSNTVSKFTNPNKQTQPKTDQNIEKTENNISSAVSSTPTTSINLNVNEKVLIKLLYKNGIYFINDLKFNETQFQVLKKELNIFILTRQDIFNNYQYIHCLFTKDVAISFNLIKEDKKIPTNNFK